MKTLLKKFADKINISLSEEQIDKFIKYKELLKEWNEKINLTAITADEDIIIKHFIDSLTIEKYIDKNSSIIDVGTGAGFPGIPIKIAREDINLTLLDSLNKRIVFLQEVLNENKIENAICIHGRAEDIAKDLKSREKYDVATARAVANMSTLLELCLPFVKVGGKFICMKGNNIEEVEEAKKALEILGGEIEKIENFVIPDTDIERNIIVVKKVKETPKQYPRKAGTPAKQPIK
ncbi:MAG: 16S rRNA (guanine(527)-N(7))-methyltransferase RsmG [Clostridia bacterium]|nr:16S rRNA (guanine(527)-N(7))-methyltransferase RsmG [Clostridia bacterium]